MIIQCEKCGAKYRLDESKISEGGTKVRCTRCNSIFVVTPPEPAEIATEEVNESLGPSTPEGAGGEGGFETMGEGPPPWEQGVPSGKEEEKGPEESEGVSPEEPGELSFEEKDLDLEEEPPDREIEEGFDIEPGTPAKQAPLEDLEVEREETGVFEGETVEGPSSFDEIDFDFGEDRTEDEGSEVADIFEGKKEGKTGEGAVPDEEVTEEEKVQFSIGTEAEKEVGTLLPDEERETEEPASTAVEEEPAIKDFLKEEEVEEVESEKSGLFGPLLLFLVLVLGGGALYYSGAMDALMRTFSRASQTGKAQTDLKLEIGEVKGHFIANENFGRLFYMETKIKNLSLEPQDIRGVRGVIYDKKGVILAARTVSPGRILSTGDLKTLPKDEIIRHFKDASGGSIPPKGTIPIMVVFTEVPKGMAEIGLEVLR